jgi:hypothetical protein
LEHLLEVLSLVELTQRFVEISESMGAGRMAGSGKRLFVAREFWNGL